MESALFNDGEDRVEVKYLHFNVFAGFVLELHIITGVLAEENFVADFEELRGIGRIFADAALAERYDNTFLRLFTGGSIGNKDAGGRHLFFFQRTNDDAVADRLEVDCELNFVFCHKTKREEKK